MLNLDYLVSFKNCFCNDVNINAFNLIEGDWVYISGSNSTAQLVYELLTLQSQISKGEFRIFGIDAKPGFDVDKNEIRKSVSYLPKDISLDINDDEILNHLSLVNRIKKSEASKTFNELKTEMIYSENIIDSNEVKHILKAISTQPKVLFIDFSFDNYEYSFMSELLDPLYKYVSKTGLSIVFCTNNNNIKSKYKSREYTATDSSISS